MVGKHPKQRVTRFASHSYVKENKSAANRSALLHTSIDKGSSLLSLHASRRIAARQLLHLINAHHVKVALDGVL